MGTLTETEVGDCAGLTSGSAVVGSPRSELKKPTLSMLAAPRPVPDNVTTGPAGSPTFARVIEVGVIAVKVAPFVSVSCESTGTVYGMLNPPELSFIVWGPGVAAEDLYVLNPDYADPGDSRPSYDGKQPVRNAAVANVVTDLLGLESVPGSQVDAEQDLDVR